MSGPASDRLRVLLTCEAAQLEASVAFYCDTLGFEREYERLDDAGTLAGLRQDGTRILLATPGAFGLVGQPPAQGVTLVLMHPDVAAHREAIGVRYEGPIGPLQSLGGGHFYALEDPAGNPVWIMQVA